MSGIPPHQKKDPKKREKKKKKGSRIEKQKEVKPHMKKLHVSKGEKK
jgi:hypothetical protein